MFSLNTQIDHPFSRQTTTKLLEKAAVTPEKLRKWNPSVTNSVLTMKWRPFQLRQNSRGFTSFENANFLVNIFRN